MGDIFSRAFRAAMLDRRAFTDAYFDNDATADGVIVVAAVSAATFIVAAVAFGRFSIGLIPGLLSSMIYGVAAWLILAATTWLAASKIFNRPTSIQAMMAAHGLAYLPLLLLAVPIPLVALAGLVWFLVVIWRATMEAASSDGRIAAVSVLIGYALLAIVALIFRFPATTAGGLSAIFG